MTKQKLDGLIAQHFFNWKWANIDFGWSNGHRGFLVPPEGHESHKAEKDWEGQYLKEMPSYSADALYSKNLREKLSDLGVKPKSTNARDLGFEALAVRGMRFRRKEIEALPHEGDSYFDANHNLYYQMQADQPQFRESKDGQTYSSWKRLEE